MGTISQFVVKVADLVEAEGRMAKLQAAEFTVVVCVYLGATALAVAGVVALSAAVFRGLVDGLDMPEGWAYLVSALILAIAATTCTLTGHYLRDHWRPER